jgi:crotonobetainyl-CoA:carnitine CoA-transferase CaiB-like acyl-CoA transferase
LAQRPTSEWLALLTESDIPCGPVNDVAAALTDEQVLARGTVEEYEHDQLGTVRRIRSPLRLSGPLPPARRAPRRGEHTEQTLAQLAAIDEAAWLHFAERGAFGRATHTETPAVEAGG